VEGFDMPFEIIVEQNNMILHPTESWIKIRIKSNELEVNRNYSVKKKKYSLEKNIMRRLS